VGFVGTSPHLTGTRDATARPGPGGFRHEALFYSGLAGFLAGTCAFVTEGVERGEPVLVVVDAVKIKAMRARLGTAADRVIFTDMADIGRNPARIIPVWQRFVDSNLRDDRPVRGIGEPTWPTRSPAELVECQAHEALLNVAFDGIGPWTLLCPYDVEALRPDVVADAKRSHRFVIADGQRTASDAYVENAPAAACWDQPLPDPPMDAMTLPFSPEPATLTGVRAEVTRYATAAGASAAAAGALTIAANEIVTNSLTHGGGHGTLTLWTDHGTLVCQVSDGGLLTGPALLGRQLPPANRPGGRGLWLANQLCDLVQIRTGSGGTVVRLHLSL